MPAVFVHGNPETDAVWTPLFEALDRDDLIALSPPGFGAAVPLGWTATVGEYVEWLTNELAAISGPIDLVGHDWGAGHVLGFLLEGPERVRSWCVDLIGITHRDYVWHDNALEWQDPDRGEAAIERWVAAPKGDLVGLYQAAGMTLDAARSAAEAVDAGMGECVLRLYRDAAQPRMAYLGEGIEVLSARPGMSINAERDTYVGTDGQAEEMASRCAATVAYLEGVGHWWMCEDPAQAAVVLEDFWKRAG